MSWICQIDKSAPYIANSAFLALIAWQYDNILPNITQPYSFRKFSKYNYGSLRFCHFRQAQRQLGPLRRGTQRYRVPQSSNPAHSGLLRAALGHQNQEDQLRITLAIKEYIGLRFKIEGVHMEECAAKEVDQQQKEYVGWKYSVETV